MKILQLYIYLFTLALATQSYGSDLAKLYPKKLAEAKNLYPLALEYFRGPGSLEPGESLTPKMVKSLTRINAFYKLRRLLGLAIDAGFDVSNLAEFGLIEENQSYYIDFKKYPQWASFETLFIRLSKPDDLNLAAYYLRKKGLSQENIEIMHQYLSNNDPNIRANLAEQSLIKAQAVKLKKNLVNTSSSSSKPDTHELLNIHLLAKRYRFDSWYSWGTNLLNQFDNQSQRIILDYLQGRLGGMLIGSGPL